MTRHNPYLELEGNYKPLSHEYSEMKLKVTGNIPEFLNGMYVRNGPNPVGAINPDAYHLFMGTGMVHGVSLRDGQADWYRNRWVRSPYVASLLGEARPAKHPSALAADLLTANTNVIGHAGKTLAISEGGTSIWELDDNLETIGGYDFDGTLQGAYTAHPLRDPKTGELHAVSFFFGWNRKVQYSVIGTNGKARRVVDIDVTGSPFMHEMNLTEKYVIFYDLPLVFDWDQFEEHARYIPPSLRHWARLIAARLIDSTQLPAPVLRWFSRFIGPQGAMPYRWDPTYPARVGVMPREGGNSDVRWFDVEPCFVFHPLNAFDTEDGVVLDVVRHPSVFDHDLRGPDEGLSTLDRWHVNFASGKIREERLDDTPQEFPSVDGRLVGRPYRYGYALQMISGARPAGKLLKHDLHKKSTVTKDFGPAIVSEFVFQPRHQSAAEDDGVLMGYVYNKETDRSDLAILDAATLDDVARIHLPTRVPNGFHGNWIPASE